MFQPLFYHEQVLVFGAKEIVCHQIYSYYKTYKLHNNHYMDIAFSLQWDFQVQSGISWVNFNHRVQYLIAAIVSTELGHSYNTFPGLVNN